MKKFLFLFKAKVRYQVSSRKHKAIGPKKIFRLYIHDEYGTKACCQRKKCDARACRQQNKHDTRASARPAVKDPLKSTALWRETRLRTQRRALLWIYHFGAPGILTWAAFTRNAETMARLHLTMDDAINRYARRRLQAGLFYVIPDKHDFTHSVRSHLYGDSEFLTDLWRKKRLERKMRRENHEICNTSVSVRESSDLSRSNIKSTVVAVSKLYGKRHAFGLLLVTSLAFAIVYL
jgi:hypothetical protein